MENKVFDALIELLWDSLKRDPNHNDRRQTGWGSKTKVGLIRCIFKVEEINSNP